MNDRFERHLASPENQRYEVTIAELIEENRKLKESLAQFAKKSVEHIIQKTTELEAEKVAREEAELRGRTDGLTELENRTTFDRETKPRIHSMLERGQIERVAILLMDIDNFKKINDTMGHAMGDAVLKGFAQELKRMIRPSDTAARYGGEEFIVVFPDASADDILRRFTPDREAQKASFGIIVEGIHDDDHIAATVSGGVSEYDLSDPKRTFDDAIKEADEALYSVKKGGKDEIVRFTQKRNEEQAA